MLVWNAVNIQSYTVFVNNNVLISCTSMTENENKLNASRRDYCDCFQHYKKRSLLKSIAKLLIVFSDTSDIALNIFYINFH